MYHGNDCGILEGLHFAQESSWSAYPIHPINTDECTHMLLNHHFINTMRKYNMFQSWDWNMLELSSNILELGIVWRKWWLHNMWGHSWVFIGYSDISARIRTRQIFSMHLYLSFETETAVSNKITLFGARCQSSTLKMEIPRRQIVCCRFPGTIYCLYLQDIRWRQYLPWNMKYKLQDCTISQTSRSVTKSL